MCQEKIAYTINDLYTILPIGKNAIYKLVNRVDCPKIRVGKRIMIQKNAFHQWFEKQSDLIV